MDVVFFATAAELRHWLEERHDTARELWIGFHKKQSSKGGITYAEAVDQALCFGWIDGVRKTLDESSYTSRFTSRKPGSIWSAVNLKRAAELKEQGLMRPRGLQAYEGRDPTKERQYSFENEARELVGVYEERLRANPDAWRFFQAQPPSYRRVASFWVLSAKKEETRLKRLATLIEDSAQGRRIAAVTYTRKAPDAQRE